MNLTAKILLLFANFYALFSPKQGKLIITIWLIAFGYYIYFINSKKFKTKYNEIDLNYYTNVKRSGDVVENPYFRVTFSELILPVFIFFPTTYFFYHVLF